MADPALNPRTGLTSFRRYTWWSLTGATALMLLFLVGEWILDPDVEIGARIVGGVGLLVTVVAMVILFNRRLTSSVGDADKPLAWLVAGCMAAAVLGGVLLAVRDYGLWSFAPATMTSVAATFLPARRRWILIPSAVLVAAALGGVVAATSGDDVLFAAAFPAAMVASFAWITLGLMSSWDLAERLNQARRLEAELAVKEERLRFAADLHDIQGHHLQVISLKSELAARLASSNPEKAIAEMKDVQRMATDALQDTRAVVQGYRRTTLADEIANATKVLAAADIDSRMDVDGADDLPEHTRHLLGLVMREATTNVLRHSQARHAEVEYSGADGIARLRVSNNGTTAAPAATEGTGLVALAERIEVAGGSLTWSHADGRFSVTASLPLAEQ